MVWCRWLGNRFSLTFGTIGLVIVLWNIYITHNDDGILSGYVVDATGHPVADAQVSLAEKSVVSIIPIMQTQTDKTGQFRFQEHGQYAPVLSAEKAGVGATEREHLRLYFRNQNRILVEPLVLH